MKIMFTSDNANCDHSKIKIIVEQEEIQQYDIGEKSTLTKVYDDINLSEPILVSCNICQFELKYEEISFEKFIPSPLLNNENIDILSYLSHNTEESDGDECLHEKLSLELYQLVQIELERDNGTYIIKELNYGEKEIYLTCDLCSTILYEFFDAELESYGSDELEDSDGDDNLDDINDIIILDDEDLDESDDESDDQ